MYKLLLILRYLRRKITPMFAILAVMLCTAMVIIVISVMGGFFQLMVEAARRLEADVTITVRDPRGFPHYEGLCEAINELPQVELATPTINAYGLVSLYSSLERVEKVIPVQIVGFDGAAADRIFGYRDTLYWTKQRRGRAFADSDLTDAGMNFQTPPELGEHAAVVPGLLMSPSHEKNVKGEYLFGGSLVGQDIKISIVRIAEGGNPTSRHKQMTVVNEFKFGLYDLDNKRVFVGFDFLQEALAMDRYEGVDDDGQSFILPARATDILIKGNYDAPGRTLEDIYEAVRRRAIDYLMEVPQLNDYRLEAYTWKHRHAHILSAVRNEKGLITFLFVVISFVAFVMVATTFYNIVLEKTRDIGALRAMGASRLGVAGIFLGYGLAIGIVGSVLGLLVAVAIVTHLNEIHDLIHRLTGWRMWDPRIYFFDRIPDTVNYIEAMWIMLGSSLSGVVGALVPAILASRVDPVEALRYE